MKKVLIFPLACLLLLSSLTGCTKKADVDSNSTVTVTKPVTIQFWDLFSGGDAPVMDQMIKDFQTANPNITVNTTVITSPDIYTKLPQAVASNSAPDVAISHATHLRELYNGGAIDPITDTDMSKMGLKWDDFETQPAKDVIYSNKKLAVPLDTHGLLFMYNKKIMQAAGLLNADGTVNYVKSPDGVMDMFTKIKPVLKDNQMCISMSGGNAATNWMVFFGYYAQQTSTPILSDDWKKVTMDKTAATKSLQLMKDLITKGSLPNLSDSYTPFLSGDAAIYVNGDWRLATLRDAAASKNLEFGVAPAFQVLGKATMQSDHHTFVLPHKDRSDKDQYNATLMFINYISTHSAYWGIHAGHVPSYKPAFNDKEFQNTPYVSQYKDFGKTSTMSVTPAAVTDEIGKGIATCLTGNVDAATAINNLYPTLETLLKTMM